MPHCRWIAVLAALMAPLPVSAQAIVAASREAAPGGGVFEVFHEMSASATGHLAFVATLSGFGSGRRQGVFLYDGRGLELVMRSGTESRALRFRNVAVNQAGAVAFSAELEDGTKALYRVQPRLGRTRPARSQR